MSYKGKFKNLRVTWIHLLKLKLDSFDAIQNFVNMAKNQFAKSLKVIRYDNALEFEDKKCKPLFEKLGINHETLCLDRP